MVRLSAMLLVLGMFLGHSSVSASMVEDSDPLYDWVSMLEENARNLVEEGSYSDTGSDDTSGSASGSDTGSDDTSGSASGSDDTSGSASGSDTGSDDTLDSDDTSGSASGSASGSDDTSGSASGSTSVVTPVTAEKVKELTSEDLEALIPAFAALPADFNYATQVIVAVADRKFPAYKPAEDPEGAVKEVVERTAVSITIMLKGDCAILKDAIEAALALVTVGDVSVVCSARRLQQGLRRLLVSTATAEIVQPYSTDAATNTDNTAALTGNLQLLASSGKLIDGIKAAAQEMGVISKEFADMQSEFTADVQTKTVEKETVVGIKSTPIVGSDTGSDDTSGSTSGGTPTKAPTKAPTAAPTKAPTKSGSKGGLTGGEIAAIVICLLVAVLGVAYYVLGLSKADPAQPSKGYGDSSSGAVELNDVGGNLEAVRNTGYDV